MPKFKRRSNADVNRCMHTVRLVEDPQMVHRVNKEGQDFDKYYFRAVNNSSEYSDLATGYMNFYATGKTAKRLAAMDLLTGDEVFVLSKYRSKTLRRKDKPEVDISEFIIDWLCLTSPGKKSRAKYGDEDRRESAGEIPESLDGIQGGYDFEEVE